MAAKRSGARSKRSQRTSPQPVQEASEPSLSRDRIVATAVELLDAQGLDGLTMRRLADRLGAGVMSLYWHVDNKEDVLDMALDSVLDYRGPPQLDEPEDWRTEVVHMLEDWRASMLRHPWSTSLLPRRALGQNILSRLERMSKTLSRAGVADSDLNAAIWSLWNYVMGATITRASFAVSDEDRAAAQQRLEHLSGPYPTIGRSRLLLDDDWDGAFRKGLGFLLDGLAPG
ncbi:TetR/AcrR family transcriptional regulator [Mesorhizobium caraganae]|uniref:TetR/AcrR family transcriptional regulator n=1 Tax=Mesorhizobium caraganae TaxID=483206 RepID=UPI001783D147|nr:TetR/AcrR family transcriptional regulator C-terminal domain-containing protein [Mesorhizobium caraganae]